MNMMFPEYLLLRVVVRVCMYVCMYVFALEYMYFCAMYLSGSASLATRTRATIATDRTESTARLGPPSLSGTRK